MRGLVSVGLFFILIASSLWFYGNGFLFKLFNGGTTLYHIADELHSEPLFLYGMIIVYILSLLIFYFEYKKEWKRFRLALLIFTSVLIIPIYSTLLK
ncbi:hypothetical protein CIB95_02165 [Lottiidibacillus patelloidae]|uniref:Uncharacterized protein n=1 Tax=Lottiidibacillus patelloidae TaxID=2670334 RepID=A0A263BZ01_9BACI|nr:hypothetical protein [Lottiidibacillus patelloidae]OZM58396.1 hypothetical protein CIB95_02165 [Lottiidibacillus patelloidae]